MLEFFIDISSSPVLVTLFTSHMLIRHGRKSMPAQTRDARQQCCSRIFAFGGGAYEDLTAACQAAHSRS